MFKKLSVLFVVVAVAVVLAGVTSVDAAREFGVITAGCVVDGSGGYKIGTIQQDDVSEVPSPAVAIDDSCAEFTRILLEQGWKLVQLAGSSGVGNGSLMIFTKKIDTDDDDD